jgi:hypothetical protein
MKKIHSILITFLYFFFTVVLFAQKVGISTITPMFKLDVKNGSINTDSLYRIEGLSVLSVKGNGSLFVGNNAGKVNTGNYNSFIGEDSGLSNTTGAFNSFAGYQSGNQNSIGNLNSFFGFQAGKQNGDGISNAFFGASAGYNNSYGDRNSFFGAGSGFSNTGNDNSFFGNDAGRTNSDGAGNSFYGESAGYFNTLGDFNVFVGRNAGYTNSTGSLNVFIGRNAGYDNTSSYSNVAIGTSALRNNAEGGHTVAIGDSALYHQMDDVFTHQHNTAVGSFAGYSNVYGYGNSFYGFSSGFSNTSSNNAFFGLYSGNHNTSGSQNCFIGAYSGNDNTTGDFNTFFGFQSGKYNTTGNENTFIGMDAGDNNELGQNNTYIGYSSRGNGDWNNVTALGSYSYITASNQVRIGNSDVTSIGGYAGWSNISDGRFKKDIRENVSGLDFILQLRPVTYTLDIDGINQMIHHSDNDRSINEGDQNAANEKSTIRYTGFVAQEVEAVAQQLGYDFSGVDAPKNENDFYGLRYAEFVVPLVKAMQEQQTLIEQLMRRIEILESQDKR